MNDRLDELSTIAKQIYGAQCLEAFVRALNIKHPAVEILISHLKAVGDFSFKDWERKGALLPLNGRGDEIPSDLLNEVPDGIRQDFFRLIDSAVEIGIVDAYGESSGLPLKFLHQVIEMLRIYKIPLPR